MNVITMLVLCFIGAILYTAYVLISTGNRQKVMKEKIYSLEEFSPTQEVMGADGNTGLAVDEERKKVCLISIHKGEVTQRVVFYKDLVSVEVVDDGTTITKTVRSSQISGALVGGLVMGGAGAIIGGLSGATKTTGKVRHVDLRIVVDDASRPLHTIDFLSLEVTKDDGLHRIALASAGRWQRVIEVLIRRADQEFQEAQVALAPPLYAIPASSIADELRKLADLQQAGILSQDEFIEQKRKLLATD